MTDQSNPADQSNPVSQCVLHNFYKDLLLEQLNCRPPSDQRFSLNKFFDCLQKKNNKNMVFSYSPTHPPLIFHLKMMWTKHISDFHLRISNAINISPWQEQYKICLTHTFNCNWSLSFNNFNSKHSYFF